MIYEETCLKSGSELARPPGEGWIFHSSRLHFAHLERTTGSQALIAVERQDLIDFYGGAGEGNRTLMASLEDLQKLL